MNFTLQSIPLLFMSEYCFTEFFVNSNFLHEACIKATISKMLGLAIILGSTLVKLPQIIKILKAKSGEGINIYGLSLELLAMISSTSYSYVNQYPFSSYGDALFMLVQTALIVTLSLKYSGATLSGLLYFSGVMTLVCFLCSGVVSIDTLWTLQALNVPVVFVGKMLQAHLNFKNKSTGQLSGITLGMQFAGSTARIFTSIQETGDQIIILTFIIASITNGLQVFQIFYYWTSTEAKLKTQSLKKKQ